MLRAFPLTLDAILLVVIVVLGWLMPALTRRDLLFGVTVAPDARSSPAGQAIIRRYRMQVIALALLAALALALLAVFGPDAWWLNGWSTMFVLAPLFFLSIPYLLAYYASRALHVPPPEPGAAPEPAAQPVAELRARHYGDYVPLIWEALPLAIIAATAIYLAISYEAAPAIIPIHFDASGQPNGYATKAIGSYFALVWTQLGLEILLTGLALLIVPAKTLPGRAASRFRRAWLRYLFGMKALTLAFMGVLAGLIAEAAQTGSASQIDVFLPITLVYVGILLASAIALAVRTGQGGSRLGSPAETAVDRMDDRYWKLGGIYVNPQDPSFFVEKRFGVGWTINFGNRWGIFALCCLLAVVMLVPILTAVLSAGH
jgi:uncharacterized membrane protein